MSLERTGKGAKFLSRVTAYAGGDGLGSLLIRSVTGTGLVRVAGMLSSFVVGVELARTLGAAAYGYYGMALAVITTAGVPGELGLPRLVTREISAAMATADLPLVFGVMQWADRMAWRISALMMIGVVAAGLVLRSLGYGVLGTAMLFGAPIIPLLTLARIRGGALQGFHFIVRGQVPDILLRPLLLSVAILAWLWSSRGLTPAAAMALNSVSAAACVLVAHLWLRRRLPGRPAQVRTKERGWLGSSLPMALTDGMRILQAELSLLLLGALATPADAAFFRIANVTSFAAATPVAMIDFVSFAIIARLHAERDNSRLQLMLTRLAQVQFVAVLLLCLPLLLAPQLLLTLVFGPEYGPAASSLRIMAVAQVITAGFGVNVALLNMTNHERRVTRAMLLAASMNLLALPLLSIRWGATGAALAFASALILWNVITWADARRELRLETSIVPRNWVQG